MLMVKRATGHEPWRLIRGELKCTAHAQDQPSPWMVQYETNPETIEMAETLKPDVGKPSRAVSIPGHAVSTSVLDDAVCTVQTLGFSATWTGGLARL